MINSLFEDNKIWELITIFDIPLMDVPDYASYGDRNGVALGQVMVLSQGCYTLVFSRLVALGVLSQDVQRIVAVVFSVALHILIDPAQSRERFPCIV